ncbi:hypothetical protein E4U13_007058 [Claviceps humidiphila]|uniref:Uncharacterized protein n=1 Tax=Claviceps humidiphila TaxID=1294629 RepID=A0A9P7TVH4_9HYPO|nr:hypothetical protein E4U13_007058 [Claviceps humidiphila]
MRSEDSDRVTASARPNGARYFRLPTDVGRLWTVSTERLSSSTKNAEKEVLDGYQDFDDDILDSDEEHHDLLAGLERTAWSGSRR